MNIHVPNNKKVCSLCLLLTQSKPKHPLNRMATSLNERPAKSLCYCSNVFVPFGLFSLIFQIGVAGLGLMQSRDETLTLIRKSPDGL